MDEDEEENNSMGGLIPLALAILGVVLGGAALYFGLTANQRLAPLGESLEAGSSSAARIERDLTTLETRLSELAAQLSETTSAQNRLRTYGNQTEQALKQLTSEVRTNREQIVKTAGQLNELAASGIPAPAPAPAREAPAAEASTGRPAPAAERVPPATESPAASDAIYEIQAGDTLARIAANRGIGLQDLLDANPEVDPRRLRIGQRINLPSN